MSAQPSAYIRQVSASCGEPAWLLERRLRAWELYSNWPPIDRAQHLWRYTDPRLFERVELDRRVGTGPEAMPAVLERNWRQGRLAAYAWVLDGQLRACEIRPDVQARGLRIMDLHRAAAQDPDTLAALLDSLIAPAHGKFEAMAHALWQGGVYLHAPGGLDCGDPVHVVCQWREGVPLAAPRLLVHVEQGAQLTLIDEYSGGAAQGSMQVRSLAELCVAAGARMHYVAVQRLGPRAVVHATQRMRLHRGAQGLAVFVHLGAGTCKTDVGALLMEENAESELLGFVLGHDRQHFDNHTVHLHRGHKSRSNLDFKVVLQDRARSAYTGLIRIEADAPFCEAYQENRNLLLNAGVRAQSIPELEILNEEVKCTHGATMGPVSREQLFYLQSRGIPRPQATRMIVEGFLEPALRRVPQDLRERLHDYVIERIGVL